MRFLSSDFFFHQLATSIREASSGALLEYDAPNAYKFHMLDQGPSTHVSCNREEGLDYYRKMQVVRRMEASANNMYKSKLIRGFCHLYSGQVRTVLNNPFECTY